VLGRLGTLTEICNGMLNERKWRCGSLSKLSPRLDKFAITPINDYDVRDAEPGKEPVPFSATNTLESELVPIDELHAALDCLIRRACNNSNTVTVDSLDSDHASTVTVPQLTNMLWGLRQLEIDLMALNPQSEEKVSNLLVALCQRTLREIRLKKNDGRVGSTRSSNTLLLASTEKSSDRRTDSDIMRTCLPKMLCAMAQVFSTVESQLIFRTNYSRRGVVEWISNFTGTGLTREKTVGKYMLLKGLPILLEESQESPSYNQEKRYIVKNVMKNLVFGAGASAFSDRASAAAKEISDLSHPLLVLWLHWPLLYGIGTQKNGKSTTFVYPAPICSTLQCFAIDFLRVGVRILEARLQQRHEDMEPQLSNRSIFSNYQDSFALQSQITEIASRFTCREGSQRRLSREPTLLNVFSVDILIE